MKRIAGVYSPVITILDDEGRIDKENMTAHIDHLAGSGLDGLLILGSLGEFYSFSLEEKKELVSLAVAAAKGRTQIIVGVGSTSLEDTLALAHYAEQAGADAINMVSPYYFAPSEEAMIAYFGKVAGEVQLPMQLYNFPARVGADITPRVLTTLAEKYANIVSIKDTVDNISHTRALIQAVKAVRPDFTVLSGFDEYYLVNRVSGGDGVLCGLTNVVPELFVRYHKAYEEGDFRVTQDCAQKISRLMELYSMTPLFVVAVKAAVKAVSGRKMSTFTSLPGLPLQADEYGKICKLLQDTLGEDAVKA